MKLKNDLTEQKQQTLKIFLTHADGDFLSTRDAYIQTRAQIYRRDDALAARYLISPETWGAENTQEALTTNR
jgi:hypothetical protein